MKDIFKGYYNLNEDEIQKIWETGFISVDANVLFNIYRYSPETRKELIRVINRYKNQLWLSNQTAFEFHKNRISVIIEQIKSYDDSLKVFKELDSNIIKNLKAPHLSKKILEDFTSTLIKATKDLEKSRQFFLKLLNHDPILTTISALFKDKIGDSFTPDEIKAIEKEGEERFKNKIPPGFKDDDKKINKYGDLIIWKELLKKAKAEGKPFILVTDDNKEDWWLKGYGKTVGPRYELKQELFVESKQDFHLYTTDRFLLFAKKAGVVKQEAINEVKEITSDSVLADSNNSSDGFNHFWQANKFYKKFNTVGTYYDLMKKVNRFNSNAKFIDAAKLLTQYLNTESTRDVSETIDKNEESKDENVN